MKYALMIKDTKSSNVIWIMIDLFIWLFAREDFYVGGWM